MWGAVIVALLTLVSSCAGRGTSSMASTAALEAPPAQVMSLIGRFGLAHACPVADHIVTAANVAAAVGRNYNQFPMRYVYQQGELVGYLSPDDSHPPLWYADLAFMQVDHGDLPNMNVLAETVSVNEKIHWYEYNYSSYGEMLSLDRRDAEVATIVAGHFSVTGEPALGASGGCVFNEADEVVGIVSFGLRIRKNRKNGYSSREGHEVRRDLPLWRDDLERDLGSTPQWAGVAVRYTADWVN